MHRRQELQDPTLRLVMKQIDAGLEWYAQVIADYEDRFKKLSQKDQRIRRQMDIPGIGLKGAVKIVATVLDVRRFADVGHYHSYCGLAHHPKTSGGRSYGHRKPRFDHTLKSVYKTAAMAVLRSNNELHSYYDYLCSHGTAEHHARHALARKIAAISYGILKNNSVYCPNHGKEQRAQGSATA
jgi:transposase